MVTKNRLGTDYGDDNEGRETSPNNRQLRLQKMKNQIPTALIPCCKLKK